MFETRSKRTWTGLTSLLSLWILACRPGPEAGDATGDGVDAAPQARPAQERGPYGVGARTLRFTDSRGKALVVEVWYPAQVPEGASPDPYPPTTLARSAVRDIPADLRGGPYPMVGFSHGFAGIRFQSVYLTEHLASHGIVVVAPDHSRNTFLDLDESAVIDVLVERPGDVAESVDALLREADDPSGWAAGLVQDGPWVAAGHSFGSFTSLVLGGAQLDYRGVEAFCNRSWNIVCGYAYDADVAGVQARMDAAVTHDPRVIATLPLSPGLWYGFGERGEGLADAAPAFFMAGDRDQILGYNQDARPTFEHHGGPASLATFDRGGHYAFSDICDIAAVLTSECQEEAAGFCSLEAAHQASATLATAYIREQFGLGVEGDAALLQANAWEQDALVSLEIKP